MGRRKEGRNVGGNEEMTEGTIKEQSNREEGMKRGRGHKGMGGLEGLRKK